MAYLVQCPEDVFKEAIETYKFTADESVKWYRLNQEYFIIKSRKSDWLNIILSNRKICYIIVEQFVLNEIAKTLK